jgi:ceramide glucosyltransferase
MPEEHNDFAAGRNRNECVIFEPVSSRRAFQSIHADRTPGLFASGIAGGPQKATNGEGDQAVFPGLSAGGKRLDRCPRKRFGEVALTRRWDPAMKRLLWLVCLVGLLLAIGLIAKGGASHPLNLLRTGLAFCCGACALFGICYTLLALTLIRPFFARSISEPACFPPVTIVKPLHGAELALLSNLSSFCRHDYPGPVQFLFGANDASDPSLKTVDTLRQLHPGAHITTIADSRLHGPNRKVSNIINMMPHAQYGLLVFADSDVSVTPNYLRNIVGELQKPGVELVTCAYRGQPDPGFWPRLSAMATNYQFLPSVLIGLALGLARPCFGQIIAMRRETLEKIGGLEQFAFHLAEDHEIGEAVRRAGGAVAIPPFVVSHACVETSFTKLVSHELRWSRTIRTINPAGYLGSAMIHPFAFALLAVLASGGAMWCWALAAGALVIRLALKLRLDKMLRQASRDLWLLPLSDLLSLAIFGASYISTHVTWRGFNFIVDSNGLLSRVEDK